MEQIRTVGVKRNARYSANIAPGIAPDVRPALENEDARSKFMGRTLGNGQTKEPQPNQK